MQVTRRPCYMHTEPTHLTPLRCPTLSGHMSTPQVAQEALNTLSGAFEALDTPTGRYEPRGTSSCQH